MGLCTGAWKNTDMHESRVCGSPWQFSAFQFHNNGTGPLRESFTHALLTVFLGRLPSVPYNSPNTLGCSWSGRCFHVLGTSFALLPRPEWYQKTQPILRFLLRWFSLSLSLPQLCMQCPSHPLPGYLLSSLWCPDLNCFHKPLYINLALSLPGVSVCCSIKLQQVNTWMGWW